MTAREVNDGLIAEKAPEASRKQAINVQAAIFASLRSRVGGTVDAEGVPRRWRLENAACGNKGPPLALPIISDVQTSKRSKTPVIVILLALCVVATFGVIIWSARGPYQGSSPAQASNETTELRNEWNQQRESLQEAVKKLEVSQQK